MAGEDESPFARVPEPGIYELPSAITQPAPPTVPVLPAPVPPGGGSPTG